MPEQQYYYDQIVIGAGTSSLTFLHAALNGTQQKFVGRHTLVVGKGADQLWARIGGVNAGDMKMTRQDPNVSAHQMGQPAWLLRPSGMPIPQNGTPMKPSQGKVDFIKTGQYNQALGNLKQQVIDERKTKKGLNALEWKDDHVTRVSRTANLYWVKTASGSSHYAKQVIIACGPGLKSSSLENVTPKVIIKGNLSGAASAGEYVDAVDYIATPQVPNRVVLVYGGSATASWAATHAYVSGAVGIGWVCRKGMEQIESEGNPIGRNSEIIKKCKDHNWLIHGSITEVAFDGARKPFDGRLEVTIKKEDGAVVKLQVDQLVHALGADPLLALGPGEILAADLRSKLEPVYDNCYRFVQQAETEDAQGKPVVIALRETRGDLWVVGAAVFRGAGEKAVRDIIGDTPTNSRYALAGSILPQGGRPPEGIAILDATINAVTGYRQVDDRTFNWNKANRRDIFMLLARTYNVQIPYSTREKMADEIIAERAATETGLTMKELYALLVQLLRRYNLIHNQNIKLNLLPGIRDLDPKDLARPLPPPSAPPPPLPRRDHAPPLPPRN